MLRTDKWKEDFLKEIQMNYKLEILAENEEYRIAGMPFYNEDSKSEFITVFKDKLGIG